MQCGQLTRQGTPCKNKRDTCPHHGPGKKKDYCTDTSSDVGGLLDDFKGLNISETNNHLDHADSSDADSVSSQRSVGKPAADSTDQSSGTPRSSSRHVTDAPSPATLPRTGPRQRNRPIYFDESINSPPRPTPRKGNVNDPNYKTHSVMIVGAPMGTGTGQVDLSHTYYDFFIISDFFRRQEFNMSAYSVYDPRLSKKDLLSRIYLFFKQCAEQNLHYSWLIFLGHGCNVMPSDPGYDHDKGAWALDKVNPYGQSKEQLSKNIDRVALEDVLRKWDLVATDKKKHVATDFLHQRRLVILSDSCYSGVWVEKAERLIVEQGRQDLAVQSSCDPQQKRHNNGRFGDSRMQEAGRTFIEKWVKFNLGPGDEVAAVLQLDKEEDHKSSAATTTTATLPLATPVKKTPSRSSRSSRSSRNSRSSRKKKSTLSATPGHHRRESSFFQPGGNHHTPWAVAPAAWKDDTRKNTLLGDRQIAIPDADIHLISLAEEDPDVTPDPVKDLTSDFAEEKTTLQ